MPGSVVARPRVRPVVLLLLASGVLFSGDQQGQLQLRVEAACDIRDTGSQVLASLEGATTVVSGISRFSYRVRTSPAGGHGEIRLRLDGGGAELPIMQFSTTVSGAGEGLAGSVPGGSTEFAVVRFGGNTHSAARGDEAEVRWSYTIPAQSSDAPTPAATSVITCH